jgi:protein O-GlcNAc transferase
MPKAKPQRPLREPATSEASRIFERTTRMLLRGARSQALKILRDAAVHFPNEAGIQMRYGDALYQGEDVGAARDAYRRAVTLDSSLFQAWYGLGMAEFSFEAYADAIRCFRRALALNAEDADVRFHLGRALFQMGDVDAGIVQLTRASKDREWRRRALLQIAVIIPGSPSRRNRTILQARAKWAALEKKHERSKFKQSPGRGALPRRSGKLRIGYVSSFFSKRNWMKPVWGVINHHDCSQFEIHLFADGGDPDSAGGYRANGAHVVHSVTDLSNQAVASQIIKAGMDVLVDLNGYSAPDRLGIYLRRPAPVMVAWFNMYAASGIPTLDYIIGDAAVIPPEEEKFYRERVLRVSGSYLAFSVLYPVPDVAPPPCLRNGYVTFGCLAPEYKITPQVIASWARILGAAPATRLLLKNTCLADPTNRAAVLSRFSSQGIPPKRLLLEGPSEHFEFLEAYSRVDIALDTFPYNGGTTTMEALWQGVPVLAVDGDRWVARISRSILLAAGLADWVEPSLQGYIQRAILLGASSEAGQKLATLREGLRTRLQTSQACDSQTLCRELENHYRTIARREKGQPRSGQPCPRF